MEYLIVKYKICLFIIGSVISSFQFLRGFFIRQLKRSVFNQGSSLSQICLKKFFPTSVQISVYAKSTLNSLVRDYVAISIHKADRLKAKLGLSYSF